MTDHQHIVGLRDLRPGIDSLLRDGEHEASLSITPYSPGVSRPFGETLTLTKYVTAPATHGLRCQFPSRYPQAGNFAPGAGRHPPGSGWPQLARFIAAHRIRMSELKSAPDTHWSEAFDYMQLDFGTDCEAAADFIIFFFEEMLVLRLRTFACDLKLASH